MVRMGPGPGVTLLISWLLCMWASVRCKPDDNPVVDMSTAESTMQGCWIYLHMNKSGGSTIKSLLRAWAKDQHVKYGLCSSSLWAKGSSASSELVNKRHPLMFGGYVESLRPYGRVADTCKWFTLFRDPVSRLVSAYFYCKTSNDQLCGHRSLDTKHTDLVTFAEHWGNYGVRQFALSAVSCDEIDASPAVYNCSKCAPWYKQKLYLVDVQSQLSNSSSSSSYEGLERFLQPAKDLLESAYVAVGVLEDFPSTLGLFTRALQMPHLDWVEAFGNVGAKKVGDHESEERVAAMRQASTDPSIKAYIHLDILLYEHAVAVHDKQVARYGVST